jgi:hypothetical protein
MCSELKKMLKRNRFLALCFFWCTLLWIEGCKEDDPPVITTIPCTGNEQCVGVSLIEHANLIGRWELHDLQFHEYVEGENLDHEHILEIREDGGFTLTDTGGIIQSGCISVLHPIQLSDTTGLNYYAYFEYACANSEYFWGNYHLRTFNNRLGLGGNFISFVPPKAGGWIGYSKIE